MSRTMQEIEKALDVERWNLLHSTSRAFGTMRQLVLLAFTEHDRGNIAEARILLNEAIDIECDVTGDAKVLGDLFEEWGGVHERDQRMPGRVVESAGHIAVARCSRCGGIHSGACPSLSRPGFTVDGECLSCGAMHAEGPCS